MKRIILSLLFMCCVLNAYGVAIITPETSFCRVSEAIPTDCDSIRTDSSCNMLCPLRDYGDMTLGVNLVCEEEYYRNCVKYCNVSCKYRCPDNMYGTVTAINAGDSIQINGVNCTVCPTGDGVLSCGGALSVFSESGTTITATSKLTCKIGYTESNGKCVADSSTAQCPEGQYLHTYNGVTACATCPANGTCANDILTCDAGYYKYTGQQSPYSAYFCCPNNATCNDTGEFQYCNDGYYGNETNGCMSCPPAATCTGGALTSCSAGYVCNADDGVVECYNCAVGDSCSNCKFNGCQDGYFDYEKSGETGREGHCVLCPGNGDCTGGKFNGCNAGYYGNKDGCFACPTGDGVLSCGGSNFTCHNGYIRTDTGCEACGITMNCTDGQCQSCADNYYGDCEDGCFKCPSLDGRPGTSVAGANTKLGSCSVSVTSSSTLNDDIGTYYFAEETCYAE